MVLRCSLGRIRRDLFAEDKPEALGRNGKAPLTIDQITAREIFFGKASKIDCALVVVDIAVSAVACKTAVRSRWTPRVASVTHHPTSSSCTIERKLLGQSRPGAVLSTDSRCWYDW
jgi:hypothetical protein